MFATSTCKVGVLPGDVPVGLGDTKSPPASTTVTTWYGSCAVPDPVTPVWLTGLNGTAPVKNVADEVWLSKSGVYSVPPTDRNVPQSPGMVSGG